MSTPHTNTVIKRVREIIAAQYMEQLSVTSLAEAVYLTPSYLCVVFKQATGKTINEYITQERLNKAKEFLAQTNIHLYDVCYKVGYLSPVIFRACSKSTRAKRRANTAKNTMLERPPRGRKGGGAALKQATARFRRPANGGVRLGRARSAARLLMFVLFAGCAGA